YNTAISLRNDDGFLYISLGNLFMQQYDYQNALQMYEKAQVLIPDYKYNYINIADVKNLLNDFEGAIKAYQEFLAAYPQNLEGQVSLANVYLDKKDYQKSIETFASALKNNPKDFRDYSNYGLALLRSNDLVKAELAFQAAVKLNNKDAMSYANLGIIQMKQDDLANAASSFSKALELDNDLHAIRFDYATLLKSRGQINEAIVQLEQFVENYPESEMAYVSLSDAYVKKNDYTKAILTLNNILTIQPNNNNIKLEIAKLYQNNAQLEDALIWYKNILESDKHNLVALYNKAVVQSHLGFNSEA
ncbi:MAG: tetratricopeptide repeat protein, partial [Candidatus Gastranaerophilales bacterium]|nr:tetratricopeptide repeat protein [Candidatus Gastranaerophilales bacterium]